ncbi:MAG: hypothetical protein SFV17_24240 [Candidatus Obscuribacter sp.]|nr:hypothetical protein [Candidatus Melainabacteria bacterium]MDX1989823.1 hypothetical protein [Candidatus Obscuribacter sp.]
MEHQAFSSNRVEDNHNQSNENFRQAALAECWPGGPIVSNPKDCLDQERDGWRRSQEHLPELQITGADSSRAGTDFAARTRRNNGTNGSDSERDAYLDRINT